MRDGDFRDLDPYFLVVEDHTSTFAMHFIIRLRFLIFYLKFVAYSSDF